MRELVFAIRVAAVLLLTQYLPTIANLSEIVRTFNQKYKIERRNNKRKPEVLFSRIRRLGNGLKT